MDQRTAVRVLRQLRCGQVHAAQRIAAGCCPGDQRHQPEAGPRPPHHPGSDYFEAFGGRIADTPGFASLEANRAGFIPKENLEHAFPEFGPYLGQCQFTGCSHRTEKGDALCGRLLAEGKLSQTRYDSYCAMYDEVKDVGDWQRPKF